MAKGKTRRRGSVSRLSEKADSNRKANEVPLPPEPVRKANGAPLASESVPADPSGALQHATSVLGGALGAGYAGARAVTSALAPDAMSAALLVCMPDEWTTDDEAQVLIHRLSNDEAAIVLAWLATQWRDGYSAAVVDLRAGRRPL